MEGNSFYKYIVVNERCGHIRYMARQALKDKWTMAFTAVLIYMALLQIPMMIISYLMSGGLDIMNKITSASGVNEIFMNMTGDFVKAGAGSFFSSIYLLIMAGPLTFGAVVYFIRLARHGEQEVGRLFSGFEVLGRTVGLFLLVTVIEALFVLPGIFVITMGIPSLIVFGSVFLIIFGVFLLLLVIIPSLMLSQVFFVMADNRNCGITNAIKESYEMMKLNWMKYFALILTFTGWILAASIVQVFVSLLIIQITENDLLISMGEFIGGCGTYVLTAYILSAQVHFYDLATGRLRPLSPR